MWAWIINSYLTSHLVRFHHHLRAFFSSSSTFFSSSSLTYVLFIFNMLFSSSLYFFITSLWNVSIWTADNDHIFDERERKKSVCQRKVMFTFQTKLKTVIAMWFAYFGTVLFWVFVFLQSEEGRKKQTCYCFENRHRHSHRFHFTLTPFIFRFCVAKLVQCVFSLSSFNLICVQQIQTHKTPLSNSHIMIVCWLSISVYGTRRTHTMCVIIRSNSQVSRWKRKTKKKNTHTQQTHVIRRGIIQRIKCHRNLIIIPDWNMEQRRRESEREKHRARRRW